ncbi:MAG: tetratricopeptide repeat protein [Acidobacteriota bacterium]
MTQYVHAAIEEGMLRRSGDGAWHVVDPSATDYERIPLPRALADLVGRRLDGLSANARAVLEAGAVLGRNVDGSLLPAVAAKQDDDILDAITELVARRVLEASPGGDLRFAHDKLREVAYGRLDGERRRAHHERAAHALSAHGSAVDDAILGHHFEQALIFDRARTCYIAAARAAVKAYAHVEAERLYRSALRLAAKPTVESITAANELGSTVLLLRGRTGEAEAIHGKAIQDSRDGDLPAMEARSQWLLGDVEAHLGRKQEALALYEQALATYRRLGDRRQEGYLQGNVGVIKKEQGRIHEALQLYGEALAIADEMGDRRQQARLLCNLANLHQEMGRADEGIAEFEKAATLARELGDRRLEGKVLGNLGVLHWDQGRVEASRALYEQALAIDRDVGDRRHEGMMLGNLATVSWVAGQLADAQRLYELGLAIAREVGNRRNEIVVLRNLAALSDEQGRREEARALHEQALAIAQATGDRRDEGIVLDNLAENARARGDPAASWELLQRALAIHAEVHNRRGEGQALGTIASLHHDAGRMEEARDSYERAIAIHGEVGDPRLEGIRMGHLARHLLFTTGDARKALDLAETGDRKLQGPHDIDRGHTLCVLGHAAIASGRSAAETLALLARLAESLTHGAASALDEPVEKLARAQCAFETGAPVVCGHALHDVTPGQLAWLRANRPEAIPSGVEKGHSSRP